MRNRWFALGVSTVVLTGTIGVTFASIFPDVPDGHVYQQAIELLVGAQVINGNPDGNFYPDNPVNRAEMIKMLYKAKGKQPDPTNARCFSDVAPGSWYESFVCDAAANKYVNGYADGTFRPANPVNRVEALKMIATIFEINISEISDADKDVVKFVDVSTAAWYTKYLYAAFANGVLPIAGQNGSRFYPEWPLLRGEAAAYIYNALGVGLKAEREEQEQAAKSSQAANQNRTQASSAKSQDVIVDVAFPFNRDGKFNDKHTYSYRFDIDKQQVASFVVSLNGQGSVTCRLYKLDEDGFSNRYYLGYQEGTKCYLLNTLSPGQFQLQLQPSVENATFNVAATVSTGDGNDGFSEASTLAVGVTRTETLKSNNMQNWYTFTVGTEANMTLELSNAPNLTCIVYAMQDVDLYGFAGPECNHLYTYPTGTYFVSVGRGAAKSSSQTYTIRLKK